MDIEARKQYMKTLREEPLNKNNNGVVGKHVLVCCFYLFNFKKGVY